MAGLDSTGLTIKSTTDLLTDMQQAEKSAFGNSVDTTADSVLGQLNGVTAQKLGELWQLLALVYASQYLSGASDFSLDNLVALAGVTRLPATQSTVSVTATGTPATVIPQGTVFSVSGTGSKFTTNAAATIAGGGTVSIACTSVDFGPVVAAAGTLTVINTPVGGLSSVTNALDATLGRLVETDAALRTRYLALQRRPGTQTLAAIQASLLGVLGVKQCLMFENTTDVTDGNGLPPHSFLPLIYGPTALTQDIVDVIYAKKPAGIQSYGSSSGTVTDSQGNTHTIDFQNATTTNIYISVTLTSNSSYGGNAAVKQALVDYGNAFLIGQSVIRSQLYSPIETVSGIVDVTNIQLGTSPSPTGTSNITIGSMALALFDTSRILVNGA